MTKEDYIGFYPSRPFWAVTPIDLEDPTSLDKFHELMSEEVFAFEEDPFKIKICRDGMILFRYNQIKISESEQSGRGIEILASRWGQYLDYLNTLYFLLDSTTCKLQNISYFNLSEITHRDAFRVGFEDNKWKGESIASESIASTYQTARYRSSYSPGLPLGLDSRMLGRIVIKHNVLEETIRIFNLIKEDYKSIKMVSTIAKSLSEYKVGNYDTSLILSWFVIETVLNEEWQTYITSKNIDYPSGKKRINYERKKYLTGRGFPVSLVSNMLEVSGVINFNLFEEIDEVRGYRNKIAHNDHAFETGASHCKLAINKAIELALKKYSLNIAPNLSYTVTVL